MRGAARIGGKASVVLVDLIERIGLPWPGLPGAVLLLVEVTNAVALVVARFADQPRIDAPGVERVGNARIRVIAIKGEDVVLGDRAPMNVAGRADLAPALDAREKPFDTRSIASYAVTVEFIFVHDPLVRRISHPGAVFVELKTLMAGDPGAVRVLSIDRHQVFSA